MALELFGALGSFGRRIGSKLAIVPIALQS